MNSKQHILQAIRRQRPEAVELPDLDGSWIEYADRRQQFIEMLEGVGGRCLVVRDAEQLNRELEQWPVYADAVKRCSLAAGIGQTNFDFEAVDDPHDLEDVDLAIVPGEFAVAENGAVWVTDAGLRHRVLYFLVQHLAVVVPADELLDNMHQAYGRLVAAGTSPFDRPGFGMFLSGPSKTADIEQSLVIGAHGPRSLTVFLLEPPPAATC